MISWRVSSSLTRDNNPISSLPTTNDMFLNMSLTFDIQNYFFSGWNTKANVIPTIKAKEAKINQHVFQSPSKYP